MIRYPPLDGARIAITGGTGSWGRAFTRGIFACSQPREVRILSRGESAQVDMREQFHRRTDLRLRLVDIRDREAMIRETRDIDILIHLAALKNISVIETQPNEALLTNIVGTRNVIDAAVENRVKAVLLLSSDKAVNPVSFYGVSKLAAERLMSSAQLTSPGTRFVTYRAGNALGSSGSVIPLFIHQLCNANRVTVTDPSMTRFSIGLREGVSLALKALSVAVGGEIFVPKMKSAALSQIIDILRRRTGNESASNVVTGVRNGEKYHELLISQDESPRAKDLGDLWVILPQSPTDALIAKYGSDPLVKFNELSSHSCELFETLELEELIEREGLLA